MSKVTSGVAVVRTEASTRPTWPMKLSALALAGFAAVRLTGLDHAGISLCMFKAFTGYPCATCGSTRAFGHLSHFDIPSAFAIQPFVTAVTLAILAWGLVDASLMIGGLRARVTLDETNRHRAILIVGALAVANWIYLLASGV
jgi:hypothetical protein